MTSNDIVALQTLMLLQQEGSFRAVALRLGVSSGAVSLTISRLEARWGVKLAHRTTRRVELTDAAKQLVMQSTVAIATFKDALTTLNSHASKLQAEVA